MSIRVGGSYADFELRLNNLRSGVKTAQEQIKLLRRDAAQPIIARFEFAGAGGGGGAAATAQTAQIERTRVQSEARIEAARITAAQRFVAAEAQAQARVDAARTASTARTQASDAQALAKIEAARIASTTRITTAEQQVRAKADALLLANAARQETLRQQAAARTAVAQLANDGRVTIARSSAEAKIEATRIAAAQRAAAADTAASAKTEAARLAAEARVEAARIATAQREAALEKRLAAQKAGGGFALPRTFAGFTAAGATQLAGAAGLIGIGEQIASGLVGATREAVALNSRLETATATIGVFAGSVQRTREMLAAIDQEAARAPIFDPGQLRAAAQALSIYTKSAEDLTQKLQTAELLAVLNPDESNGGGLAGAAFALREAMSGDYESVVERFSLPRSVLNNLKEGKKTSEEFYQVVVQALSQLGVNDNLVQAQTRTTTGRIAALRGEFRILLQEVGKPIFAQMGQSIERLSALVQDNKGALTSLAQTIGQGLATGLRVATTGVELLVKAWGALGPMGQRVVVSLAGAYAASKLTGSGLSLLSSTAQAADARLGGVVAGLLKGDFTLRQFGTGLKGAIAAQGGLNQTLGAMLGPASAAQAAILLVAGAWTYGQAQIDAYVAKQKQAITIIAGAQAQIKAARQNDPNNSMLDSFLSQQEGELKRLEDQKNTILDQVRQKQGSFTQGKGVRGGLETLYTGTIAGLGKAAEGVAGLLGDDQYVSAWTRAADSMLNTGNASQQATSEINALQGQVRATQEQISAALPFLNQYGAGIGTAAAQFQSGTINAAQFANTVKRLTGLKVADTFGIVQGLSQLPGPERVQKLEVVFRDLLRQMNENPTLAQNYIPQLQAIGAEIGRLKAAGPIVVSVEMRQQMTGAVTESYKAITDRTRQVQAELTQLDSQYSRQQVAQAAQAAKAWQGYIQQAGKAQRDFAIQQGKAQRDFAIQQGKAQRDFYQGEQKAQVEHTRRLVDMQRKLADDLAQIERDKQRKLRDLQREFDIDQTRKQEDFQEERQKLLAEGRIAESRELERKFGKDQRRAQEDLTRNKSETVDDAGSKATEKRGDSAQEIADEKAQFIQQRAERLRAFAQQQADARSAFAQQQADARSAFAQQQADARAAAVAQQAEYKAQAAAEQAAYKENRQKILDGLALFVTEQQAKLKQSKEDMLAISALITSGMDENEARLKVGLDNSKAAWLKTMSDLKDEMGPAGYRAMTAWQQGAASALTAGIPEIDRSLRPMRDRLVPQSPLRAGPLKNHERGAAKAAQMYMQGFASGLDATTLDPQLEQFRRRLTAPTDPTRTLRQGAQAAAAGQAGQAGQQQQHVQLQIALPSISMDGRTVGQIVGPHVEEMIVGNVSLQLQVLDSSKQSSLQQETFRTVG